MEAIKKIYNGISSITDWAGRTVSWIIVMLVLIVSFEVMMRYVFNAPTIWTYDISYMILAIFVAVGFAFVLRHRGHVRVDVIYNKFPPKGRLIIDITFTLILFFPLFFMLTIELFQDALYALQVSEKTNLTYLYVITWPYKTIVFFGITLLFLQGVVNLIRDIISLAKGGKEPW
ncbi:TRAP transporter small permease subunit [Chloroflexota bacterium]